MSVLDTELRRRIECKCKSLQVPHVSVLDPVLNLFGAVLDQNSQNKPGEQRQLDSNYYRRISGNRFCR